MNILAIRLKNLASLAGEHEIDFTQEPLASAGLFAITGPTGAGKSTLLDALCLALFGSTPRLTGVSLNNKVPDGDDELGGGDERNLLRRGCANGYAEVDFVGLDGDHYRARWEVRRARDRATGRLQSSQQSLHNLTTQQVLASGKKREFHDALEAKLGLSFAQFTRAVLLAQSEFSAFLKADDNERGSLLEKLTDTALYSRLGQAAYEKRKQAQAERDQLERQLGDIKPLNNDARAALEQQLNDAEAALQQLNKTREEWLAQSQWLDSADQLHAQLTRAKTAQVDAQHTWETLTSARALIEQFDACADVREPYMRRQRLLEQQQRLSEQQPTIEARSQQTKAAVEQAQAQLNAANESYNAAQTQQKNAEPAIAEARVARQATLAAEQQLAQTQRALTLVESELSQAQTQLKDTERKHGELSEQQQQLQRALEPSAELESLIDGWPLLSESWQNLLRQRSQLQRLTTAQTQLNTALTNAKNAAAQAEQPIAALNTKYQQQPLNQLLQTLSEQLSAHDKQLIQLNQQQDIWQRYHEADRQCSALEQAIKTSAEQCEKIIADGKQARANHDAASAELKSLQTVLEAQRLARLPSVEELRQQLQPDSPCPVCGSLEHPLHSSAAQDALNRQAAADNQLLAVAEAKVQIASERLLTLRDQHITLNSQQKLRHEQLEREQRNRAALLDRLTALALPEAFWQQTYSAQQHWFSEQHSALTQLRTAVAERIEQCRADQAQLETLHLALNAAHEALRAQQQAVDKNASDCEHVQQTLDNLSASLLTRLPASYHEQLASDDPGTYQQLDARIQQRIAHQQQLRALEPDLAECSTILHQQQSALPNAQAKQQSALNEAAQAQQTYDHAASALRSCLGEHHSIELWQQQLSTQREEALNRLNQCRDHEAQQQLAMQAAEHALQSLQTRLEEIRTEYTLADHQVKTWLTEHLDWQPEQLAHLMALPNEHVQRQRQQLAEAKDALSRAEERYLSVEQQWQAHQQRYPQAPTRETVAQQLEHLQNQFDAQQSEAERLRSECLLDDQRRVQANQWLAQLDDAQTTYLRWAKLADLIGSADGAAFRRIAQGYNLDLLVQHANVQLRQLAKRYRLQRGGSPLGLLVLDTDMGDELRSVHSLSGGETFLVSLALALGLASMASSKMPINSLFIDEGFGSLDPESLQVAMDALDNLQAQGRKVAVISHVAEMHERIPVKVQVQRQGNGQSSVQIVAG